MVASREAGRAPGTEVPGITGHLDDRASIRSSHPRVTEGEDREASDPQGLPVAARFQTLPVSASPCTGSAEFELLCRVARPRPDLGRARKILSAGVDFAELFSLAEYHGVRPQLVESLYRMSWEAVPAATRSSFENFRRIHGARALFVSHELCRLSEAFDRAGIRYATFKGPTLAALLHGDVSRREYVDIDIIVPGQQMEDAERMLGEFGYRAADGPRAYRQAFLAHLRQYAFVHPDSNLAVDLHWNFSGTHVPFPLTPEALWQDLDTVTIGNRAVTTPSRENLALLLAGHGTKEAWRSLGWICDFATLIDRYPDLDWLAIHERAAANRCGDTVLLGCAMAEELAGTLVPRPLLGALEKSSRVRMLARRLAGDLREGLPDSPEGENFSDFHLCERPIDRIVGALRLAFIRTSGDYDAMRLPQVLWPAYYATRPFRLAAKAMMALGRRTRR